MQGFVKYSRQKHGDFQRNIRRKSDCMGLPVVNSLQKAAFQTCTACEQMRKADHEIKAVIPA